MDFRKQFQEIIEQSYIPFNIDKTATSDVWSNIYKLILPNIPEKLFRYRRRVAGHLRYKPVHKLHL